MAGSVAPNVAWRMKRAASQIAGTADVELPSLT
jgi:hypothetical protein